MNNEELTKMFNEVMAKYPKARRIAVENFSLSASDTNARENRINLGSDTNVYKWKGATVNAIKMAMKKLGRPI